MKGIKFLINEHINNFSRIHKLAIHDSKVAYARTTLGYWWTLYKDILYFLAYGFFMYLVFSNTNIQGVPRLIYLVSGLIPWYFISESLSGGARAIKKKGAILTKIKFPISIVPTIEILSIFYRRLASYLIIVIIFGFYSYIDKINYLGNINYLYFAYAMFISLLFMICFNFLISGLVAISKDFSEIYSSFVRILFFFIPVIWSMDSLIAKNNPIADIVVKILKANPLVYIIESFRGALIGTNIPSVSYTIYFFIVTFVVFILGAILQNKLKKYYGDFL